MIGKLLFSHFFDINVIGFGHGVFLSLVATKRGRLLTHAKRSSRLKMLPCATSRGVNSKLRMAVRIALTRTLQASAASRTVNANLWSGWIIGRSRMTWNVNRPVLMHGRDASVRAGCDRGHCRSG